MFRITKKLFVICLIFFSALFFGQSLEAETKTPEELSHLLQMPVAVNQASQQLGISDRNLKEIAAGLNRGELPPWQFNAFLRQTPALAASFESIDRVGAFVTSQVRAGLRGEELVSTIHKQLRQRGIPAEGLTRPAPPPLQQDDFFPPRSRERIRRAREAQQLPEQEQPPGGPPAQTPQQPGMSPGGGMPGPGTMP